MDDHKKYDEPTKENILRAYEKVVTEAKDGDAIFLHYSGHGSKVSDKSGDEDDRYDEVLVPLDYKKKGMIVDDDLYDILIKKCPDKVHSEYTTCIITNSLMSLAFEKPLSIYSSDL